MRKWMSVGMVAAFLVSLLAGACESGKSAVKSSTDLMRQIGSQSDQSEQDNKLQNQSDTNNNEDQNTMVDSMENFRQDMSDFAIALFKESAKEADGANMMVSPLSVVEALGMTANGANQETLDQMIDVLGKRETQEELNQNLKKFTAELTNSKEAKFHLANGIWFKDSDSSFTVNQDFLQANRDYYDAGIYQSALDAKTVDDINHWVAEQTDGMIPHTLDKIDPRTVMLLANAIAFEGKWMNEYEASDVWEGDFMKKSGESKTTEFMHSEEETYLEDEHATGFMKPYKEGYSFVALLPEEEMSVEDYVTELTGEKFLSILEEKQTGETVVTAIPKFTSEYTTSLKSALGSMGMTDAFDEELANFTGIGNSLDGSIYIGEVLHKTYIEVDELGTKAAAVTVVTMETCGIMEDTKEVILDRPFLYAIVDNETNLPIFIGTYQGEELSK